MARVKTGLEYFSVDVTWDTKMKLMKAKYGLQGVGLIIELYKTIYQEGYYYPWNEETRLLFAAEHNIDEIPLSEMIHFAIGKGLFDIGNWKKDSILTSSGIQKRYLQASLKRKEVVFHKDFLLIEPKIPEWCKTKLVIYSKKPILISESVEKDSETPLSDSSSTQSKVKESKVNSLTSSSQGSDLPVNKSVDNSGSNDLLDPEIPDDQVSEKYQVVQDILKSKYSCRLHISDLILLNQLFQNVYPSTVYAQLNRVFDRSKKIGKDPPEAPIQYIHSYMKNWTRTTKNQEMMRKANEYDHSKRERYFCPNCEGDLIFCEGEEYICRKCKSVFAKEGKGFTPRGSPDDHIDIDIPEHAKEEKKK